MGSKRLIERFRLWHGSRETVIHLFLAAKEAFPGAVVAGNPTRSGCPHEEKRAARKVPEPRLRGDNA